MAKKKFLVNIDLNLNQLINSRAENGTGFTTGGINYKGRLMYDTSTNRVLYDTGVAIETIANLNDVSGLLEFQGGYNALTNTPNLINPPSGTINKGDYYIVTVEGTFYGTLLEIGDSLFASVDNPTTINGWVIVQANVVYATETIAGIILLATQEEVNTGTNNSKAITPLTLATYVTNNKQNIYNIDGTLTANRTITLADKNLTFTGVGNNIFQFNINNGVQYSQTSLNANLINSSIYNTTLQLNSATTVQNGVVSLKVYNDALTVDRSLVVNSFGTRINSSYYLPNTDGTAGQVVITDGAGNLSFGNAVLGSGATNSLAFWSSTSTISFDVALRRGTSGGNAFIQALGTDADVTIGNGGSSSGVDIRSNLNGISSIYSFGFGSSVLSFQRRRGTKSAPTDALNGDVIGNIAFNNVGVVQVRATENATSGWGNTVTFFTGVQGTTTQQEVLRLTNDKKVKISNVFFLPNTDGTAGQVMTTDGAGNVSWGNTSSTNIYNTNGTLTGNRTLNLGGNGLSFFGNVNGEIINTTLIDGVKTSITEQTAQLSSFVSQDTTTGLFGSISIADDRVVFVAKTSSTEFLGIQADLDGLLVNQVYYLPKTKGLAGQVLTTDGASPLAQTSWSNVSSTNIYNTNGTVTTNRTIDFNNKTLEFTANGGVFRVSQYDFLTEKSSGILAQLTSINFNVNDSGTSTFGGINLNDTEIVNSIANDTNSLIQTHNAFGLLQEVKQVGATVFSIAISEFGLNINSAYILPKVDGTAGQVLTTNGLGVVTWGAGSGSSVNIYNTDGTLTANRIVSGNAKTITFNNFSAFAYNIAPIVGTVQAYEIQIDSTNVSAVSVARLFRIVDSSSGFERFGITKSGNVKISDAFILPLSDGTAGQVLTTNGAGNVSWGNVNSGSGANQRMAIWSGTNTLTSTDLLKAYIDGTNTYGVIEVKSPNSFQYFYLGLSTTTSDNGIRSQIDLHTIGNVNSILDLRRSRGDIGSATPVLTNDILGQITYSNSSYRVGEIRAVATEDSTPINNGTKLEFLNTKNGTSSGFVALTLDADGRVKISSAYKLPLLDGTSGQVMTTDGAGNVSWGNSSSTNIYNTNGTLTANRTATLGNFNLSFSGVGTGGATSFTRTNGASISTSLSLSYNNFSFSSVNATETASLIAQSTQIITSVADTSFSSNIQQLRSEIRFFLNDEGSSSVINSLILKSNGLEVFSNYTLPKTAGTSGQVLVIDGSGNVNWTTIGVGTSDIFKLNPNETYRGFSFNNNSTTIVSDGGAVASASASTLAQTVASTTFATKQVRLRYYASVVSAGRYTGLRGTALLWFMQGGFRFCCDFNISDTAYSSGTQQFYGVCNSTADLNYGGVSGILVSTLLNMVGVGNDTNDANLQIFHNDGTGTATKIDLGASFPANRTSGAISTTFYEVQLINVPATTTVLYRVVNKETGAIASGTLTTNLPDPTLGLNFFASRCMSTLSSVTNSGQFDLAKLGVYSMI